MCFNIDLFRVGKKFQTKSLIRVGWGGKGGKATF